MANKTRIFVVTNESGKAIAINRPRSSSEPKSAVRAGLRAGPGQKLHEIEIEYPEKIQTQQHVQELHDRVHRHLKENRLI